MKATTCVLVFVLVSALACGGGGSGQCYSRDGGPLPSSCAAERATIAQNDCQTYIAASFCPRVLACEPPGSITEADCIAAAQVSLDCGSVKDETAELGRCES